MIEYNTNYTSHNYLYYINVCSEIPIKYEMINLCLNVKFVQQSF